jgi:acetoin utilization deacetylase AcuC-like enzyme
LGGSFAGVLTHLFAAAALGASCDLPDSLHIIGNTTRVYCMKAYFDPIQLTHAPSFFLQRGRLRSNFEIPRRAEVLLEACRNLRLDITAPGAAEAGALLAVHTPDYLEFLRQGPAAWAELPERGDELVASSHPTPEMVANGAKLPSGVAGQVGWFTADASCPISATTWAAAEAAASGAIAAADEAAAGRHAYALARPPGHHAYAARAGGHCYLNNAAIAAERLRAQGAARVAILDIDSHHGNGTQGIFWTRDDVLFISVHGDPNRYYPWFVGHAEERGGGAGIGFNRNFPLPIGSGDESWLAAIGDGLAAIDAFGADSLVISLGFDASKDEPLASLLVTEDGFARAGAAISRRRLPTAVIQEGGYNTDVIGDLLTRFLGGLAG